MKKRFGISMIAMVLLAFGTSPGMTGDVFIDLSDLFDRDGFVTGGAGQGNALDDEGNWLDTASLPTEYSDGSPLATSDGLSSFLYGQLKGEALDCLRVNAQSLPVSPGQYDRLHLALLSPDAMMDLSRLITLQYADGTAETVEFAPFTNWYDSPARFFDNAFSWIDNSGVEDIVDIQLQQNDEPYLLEIIGGSPSQLRDDYRFVDGGDSLTYEFELPADLTAAKLGIDMQNNFVVGISTDFGGSYTEVLNSMEMFGEDIHSGSNRDIYDVDLAPILAETTDNIIWVRFTDGTTSDGWGPAIWNIRIYTGELIRYEGSVLTEIDTSNATVYADFRTDSGEAEEQYLVDQQSVAPSSAMHRYADSGGFCLYGFDLPDEVTEAKAAINMEANFVVSVATQRNLTNHVEFVPGGDRDEPYIWVDQGSANAGSFRFVDGSTSISYLFELPADLTEATLNIDMQNNFLISVGKEEFEMDVVLDSMDMFGVDYHDGSNRNIYQVDLAPYLQDNPTNEVFVEFRDGSTSDGWGPAMFKISIQSGTEGEYTQVLSAQESASEGIVPYAATNGSNKGYYYIDLSPFLANNPGNEIFVKFTDGTTNDGWGPGLFRFIVYSGEIVPRTDGLCITGLTTTGTLPPYTSPWGVNLMRREFPVDPGKTLASVSLPAMADDTSVYLFAATLEGESTAVDHWSVY